MRSIAVSIKGITPLLMHADDVLANDELMAWRKDPNNKRSGVAGDDRCPAWTWHSYIYSDGTHLVWPVDALQVALRNAGKSLTLKGKKTFKTAAASGLIPSTEYFEFLNGGKQIKISDIKAMRGESFTDQIAMCKKLGFDLFVKRAVIGTNKHVRVRPIFRDWEVRCQFHVTSQELTDDILTQLFTIAGAEQGIGDWRPSSPRSPGSYGLFAAGKITKA